MIFIKDNFFSDLIEVKQLLQKVPVYSAQDWENTYNEKINWQGNRSNDLQTSNINLFDKIKENIEHSFKNKFKINLMCLHERKDERMNPHLDTDGHDTNCLIFISGKKGFCNGTGFYSENELSITVGFQENRALLFPSNYLHSCLQALYPNTATSRVTINCFMNSLN